MVEWFFNVDTNIPTTNSAFIIVALAATGIESDAILRDKDDFNALFGAGAPTNEVTNTGYARKVITDADITFLGPDDTGDQYLLDIATDPTWTSVGVGDVWSDIVIGYDTDTATGTDANIIPGTHHDFSVTPDGSNITAQLAAAGFFRAVSAS